MCATTRRLSLAFAFGLCAAGLTLHFAVESLVVPQYLGGGYIHSMADRHEEDNFVLDKPDARLSSQARTGVPCNSNLNTASRPVPPLLEPPRVD